MIYDLEDRTKKFSKEIINFLKSVKLNSINQNIVSQLTRSATSVGANYHEANGAISTKDFFNKIAISRKEARETEYWIELLADASPEYKDQLRIFWAKAHEFVLIFGKICNSPKNKKLKN
jgi:four helix bundle protein